MTNSIGLPYSATTGVWKSIKDGVVTLIALGLGGAVATAVQVEAQCPELTLTAMGVSVGIKVIVQFLNNYRKNA